MLDAENGIGTIKFALPALTDGSSMPTKSANQSQDNAKLGTTQEPALLVSSDITLITEPALSHQSMDLLTSDAESGIGPTKFVSHALKDGPLTQKESAKPYQDSARPGIIQVPALLASSDTILITELVSLPQLVDLLISDVLNGTGTTKSASLALKDGPSMPTKFANQSLDNVKLGITTELVLPASSDTI